MKALIGISGKKQSGKDSLASYLSSYYYIAESSLGRKRRTKRVSFAGAIKEFCISVLGLTRDQCYGSDEDKNSMTKYLWDTLPFAIRAAYSNKTREWSMPSSGHMETWQDPVPRSGSMSAREIMQVFGTDIMRNMFDQSIWVQETIRRAEGLDTRVVMITDVRFVSEVEALLQRDDAYVIRLTRNVAVDNHPTETALDEFDFSACGERVLVIDNENMSLEEQGKAALPFFKAILHKIRIGNHSSV